MKRPNPRRVRVTIDFVFEGKDPFVTLPSWLEGHGLLNFIEAGLRRCGQVDGEIAAGTRARIRYDRGDPMVPRKGKLALPKARSRS